jgi:trimeric autotransporter adhesin
MHLSSLNASQPESQLQFTSADSPAPLLPAPVPHSSSPPTSTAYVCLDTFKAYSVQYPASAPPGLKAALCGAVVTSDSSSNSSSSDAAATTAAPAPLLVAVTADGCAPCAYVTVDVATTTADVDTAGSTAWVIAGPTTAKGDAPSRASVCLPAGTYALTAPAAASVTLCGQPLTGATAAAISAATSATAAAVNQAANSTSTSNSNTDNSSDIESAAAASVAAVSAAVSATAAAAAAAADDDATDTASVFYFNINAAGSCAGCSPSAVTLQDSYGDGWSGSYITVAPLLVATQGPGAVLWRSTLAYGAASTESACLPPGYYVLDLDLSKGTFPDEMAWGFCGRSGDYKTSAFVFEVSAAGVCTWVRNISTERKIRVAPGDVGDVGGDEPPPTCFSVAVVDVQGCFVEARSSRAAQPAVSVTFVERLSSSDSSSTTTAAVSSTTISLTPTASSTTVCLAQGSWGLSASASDSSENSSVCARSLQLSLCSAAAVKVGAPVEALTLALGTDNVCTVETKPGAVLTHTFSTTVTANSSSGSNTQCSARVCTTAAASAGAATAFWSTQPCSAGAVAREHNAATTNTISNLSMHKLVTAHVGASSSEAVNTRAQYIAATATTTAAAYSADRGGYSLTFEC